VIRLSASGLVFLFIQLLLSSLPGRAVGGDKDALPNTEQVIERYIDAVGGRQAIKGLTSRVSVGRMIHDLSWKAPSYEVIPILAYSKVPDCILVVEHKSDGIRCEGSDGDVTWVQDPGGVELKDDPIWRKTAWLFDPQGALQMNAYFPGLEIRSRETLDGRQVYALLPAELDETHYTLYFDVDTGLLVRIGYYWELEDYREVDGVRLPFRVAMSRKGGSSTYKFDLVKHNLPLDDVLFAAPSGPER
jgi:hypothetical protein